MHSIYMCVVSFSTVGAVSTCQSMDVMVLQGDIWLQIERDHVFHLPLLHSDFDIYKYFFCGIFLEYVNIPAYQEIIHVYMSPSYVLVENCRVIYKKNMPLV